MTINNSQNISQALDQLKREIQKETADLSTKETQLKSVGVEKERLGVTTSPKRVL